MWRPVRDLSGRQVFNEKPLGCGQVAADMGTGKRRKIGPRQSAGS
jgi:hypothetical protein